MDLGWGEWLFQRALFDCSGDCFAAKVSLWNVTATWWTRLIVMVRRLCHPHLLNPARYPASLLRRPVLRVYNSLKFIVKQQYTRWCRSGRARCDGYPIIYTIGTFTAIITIHGWRALRIASYRSHTGRRRIRELPPGLKPHRRHIWRGNIPRQNGDSFTVCAEA
jgi:hypothetical protein